ncbi:MAG: hypothetical protein EBQ92_12790 [Proteobacteria bacterium]|nr:hypothetical protein [Pseudomonadota bacterium]
MEQIINTVRLVLNRRITVVLVSLAILANIVTLSLLFTQIVNQTTITDKQINEDLTLTFTLEVTRPINTVLSILLAFIYALWLFSTSLHLNKPTIPTPLDFCGIATRIAFTGLIISSLPVPTYQIKTTRGISGCYFDDTRTHIVTNFNNTLYLIDAHSTLEPQPINTKINAYTLADPLTYPACELGTYSPLSPTPTNPPPWQPAITEYTDALHPPSHQPLKIANAILTTLSVLAIVIQTCLFKRHIPLDPPFDSPTSPQPPPREQAFVVHVQE